MTANTSRVRRSTAPLVAGVEDVHRAGGPVGKTSLTLVQLSRSTRLPVYRQERSSTRRTLRGQIRQAPSAALR
jgi:hypothetical protein